MELLYLTSFFLVGATALFFYLQQPRKASRVYARRTLGKELADQTLVPETTIRAEQCGTGKDFNLIPRYAKSGIASYEENPAVTIPAMMQLAVKKRGDSVALRFERVDGAVPPLRTTATGFAAPSLPWSQWTALTWAEYHAQVRQCAKAFIKCGVGQFDAVNIFGFNSPEWFIADLGVVFAGGRVAGIYPTDTSEQVVFKSRHSSSKVAVVETAEKVKPFSSKIDELPLLTTVVVWSAGFDAQEHGPISRSDGSLVHVYSWAEFMSLADDPVSGITDAALDTRIAQIEPGMCTHLIYTSGTTGNPKAVMVSHDNVLFVTSCVVNLFSETASRPFCEDEEERFLSYLPLSHGAGMMVDIIFPITAAAKSKGWASVAFARNYDLSKGTLVERLKTVKPTVFLGVPRVWEKMQDAMKAVGAKTVGLKRKVADWGKKKGMDHANATQLGGDGTYPPFYGLADAMVLGKVKSALGLQCCKYGFTGAAPIGVDTLKFFATLGITINEVYGMSESSGVTTWSSEETHLWGSCGWAMPGIEVSVRTVNETDSNAHTQTPPASDLENPSEEQQGEICFRGRHIMMGYMGNSDLGEEHLAEVLHKTNQSIDQYGWLHSGDKGCMNKDGMFRITGRYKELIIGAGGENIAPVPIENAFKSVCKGVSNVMMIGDKRKYNTAVVTLLQEGATGDAPGNGVLTGDSLTASQEIGSTAKTAQEAMACQKWQAHIEAARMAVNQNTAVVISNACKIQKVSILCLDFSVQTGELTPTLKLKRGFVMSHNQEIIDQMY